MKKITLITAMVLSLGSLSVMATEAPASAPVVASKAVAPTPALKPVHTHKHHAKKHHHKHCHHHKHHAKVEHYTGDANLYKHH